MWTLLFLIEYALTYVYACGCLYGVDTMYLLVTHIYALFKLTSEVLLVNKQYKKGFRKCISCSCLVPVCLNGQLQHSQPGNSSGRWLKMRGINTICRLHTMRNHSIKPGSQKKKKVLFGSIIWIIWTSNKLDLTHFHI